MGKTVPSYRVALEEELRRWSSFSKALRDEDRKMFEDMMNACRLYASASGAATIPIILEAMLMAILLSHHKTLKKIESKLREMVQQNERMDSRPLSLEER